MTLSTDQLFEGLRLWARHCMISKECERTADLAEGSLVRQLRFECQQAADAFYQWAVNAGIRPKDAVKTLYEYVPMKIWLR